MRFRMTRRALPAFGMAQAVPAAAEAWRLEAPGGALHGTLVLPAGEGRVPAALLLAASGPRPTRGMPPWPWTRLRCWHGCNCRC